MDPTTYEAALALAIISMLCWGSWANTFKMTKGWRFELFYFDYSLGVLVLAVVAAFTFGSSIDAELTVMDNYSVAGKRQLAYAFLGGCIFNLANMLLVAAISVAGLAVAFPVGIGLALVIGVLWNYVLRPSADPLLLFGGVALVVGAIVVDAMAYREHAKRTMAGSEGLTFKGILLCIMSGLLMGSFYPVVQMSMVEDIGLTSYAAALLFSIGVFASTFLYNLYFMNLPVVGPPLSIWDYFRGGFGAHALGLVGGMIWCTGLLTNFVAGSGAGVKLGPAVSYGLGQGATMISALWGLLVWREFHGATGRVRRLLLLMFALFLAGLTLVSIAPLYAGK